jgi:2-polyprenyl-3-methyl-5-hydroxy-6-metoxy-1,4-benzoquinol methylase
MEKCIACNQTNCLTYFKEEIKLISCNECGAIFSLKKFNEKPTFYQESHKTNLLEKIKAKIYIYVSKLYSNEYIKYLKSKTKINFKNALEIGSKYGTLVKDFNKMGIDAYGIESDQRYIQLGVTKKIKWEFFDENYHAKTKYDLICLTQMLYFLPDSYEVLKCVKNMLTENGLIFIASTNPESSLVKGELKQYISGSVMLLSKKNFESLDNKIGLKLLDYSTYRADYAYELLTNKNKNLVRLKFLLIRRKLISPNPDGNICFILLKPTKP